MEFCKDMAQHRKRLNEDSFMIEKGEEPRSSAVKMKIRAKKNRPPKRKMAEYQGKSMVCCSIGEEILKRNL